MCCFSRKFKINEQRQAILKNTLQAIQNAATITQKFTHNVSFILIIVQIRLCYNFIQ